MLNSIHAPPAPGPDFGGAPHALSMRVAALGSVSGQAARRVAEIGTCTAPFDAGRDILTKGDIERAAYAVISGWGCLYEVLDDGRRQIFSFVLPGDIVNSRPAPSGEIRWSFAALTNVDVARIDPAEMEAVRGGHSRAAAAMAQIDGLAFDLLADRLTSLGRRTAFERLAHMLVELYARLRAIGAVTPDGFELPANQEAIADSMGLSAVHVSRTFKKLRQDGLVTIKRNQVEIHDFGGLLDAAGLDYGFVERLWPHARDAGADASASQIPDAGNSRRCTNSLGAAMPQAA